MLIRRYQLPLPSLLEAHLAELDDLSGRVAQRFIVVLDVLFANLGELFGVVHAEDKWV